MTIIIKQNRRKDIFIVTFQHGKHKSTRRYGNLNTLIGVLTDLYTK